MSNEAAEAYWRQWSHRSQETQDALRWFEYGHLPEGKARSVCAQCAGLAIGMVNELPDGHELLAGLRKLREANNHFLSGVMS